MLRVSYSGYYVSFPRMRLGSDSPYPHQGSKVLLGLVFYLGSFFRVVFWFNEDEEFAEDVVEDDDDDLSDELDDAVVKVEQGNENEHYAHVDEKSEKAAGDKFDKFGEGMFFGFDLEDEAAVRKIGK